MYKIKLNDNVTLQLSDTIGTSKHNEAIEIIGIEITNGKDKQEYSLSELKDKIELDVITIAKNQLNDYIQKNIDNPDILKPKSPDSHVIHLITHEVKEKDLFPKLNFKLLSQYNTIIAEFDFKIVYWNVVENTYKLQQNTRNIGMHTEYYYTDDLRFVAFDVYLTQDVLLLKSQLKKGTAHEVYKKCDKINDFIGDKKSIRVIFGDQELVINEKNLSLCRLFSIDSDMKLQADTHHIGSYGYNEIRTITLKHGRKAISFSINSSVDDVKYL